MFFRPVLTNSSCSSCNAGQLPEERENKINQKQNHKEKNNKHTCLVLWVGSFVLCFCFSNSFLHNLHLTELLCFVCLASPQQESFCLCLLASFKLIPLRQWSSPPNNTSRSSFPLTIMVICSFACKGRTGSIVGALSSPNSRLHCYFFAA